MLFPMIPNPGGGIAPNNVLGRDPFIRRFWKMLEARSVVLASERRLGKTCVIQKMAAEPLSGFLAVYCDLESVSTPDELVRVLERHTAGICSKKETAKRVLRSSLKSLHGLKIKGCELPTGDVQPWKVEMVALFADLAMVGEKQQKRIVLLLDEVPFMLHKMAERGDRTTISEVLSVLRTMRQEYRETLRMVYTGSVGLHHILSEAQVESLLNDMYKQNDLPPLLLEDAQELAHCLILGAHAQMPQALILDDVAGAVEVMVEQVDAVPFYIHHIASHFSLNGGIVSPGTVLDLVAREISNPEGGWELPHFRHRMLEYYPDDNERRLAIILLDTCAHSSQSCTLDMLQQAIFAEPGISDIRSTKIEPILRKLTLDHYLVNTGGSYTFRFSLIQRWWAQTNREYAI